MCARPATASYRDQLQLNAQCIDLVHGGVYAWLYLSNAGLPEAEILRMLNGPAEDRLRSITDAQAIARSALGAAGIHPRPIPA